MRATLISCCVLLAGCANDLRVDHPFETDTPGELVIVEVLEGGLKRVRVDATSKTAQVFLDLDEGREMKLEEAFSSNGWELSFKRDKIGVNSGPNAPTGTVDVAVLSGVDFDALTQAPATGLGPDTGNGVFNPVGLEGGWYFYDLGVHRLVPRTELMYVLHTSAGAYVKLRMLEYYDAAGTPASITLEYAPIAAP
ncbi:MAG: HmuY family protein [Archangium sp.]|nr:HmuY family protein [Archangium sp.]